jgi:carboxypeptidase family protein
MRRAALFSIVAIVLVVAVAWWLSRDPSPPAPRPASSTAEPGDAPTAPTSGAPATRAAEPAADETRVEIAGIVRDDATGEGVAEALVTVDGTADRATTDRDGGFRLATAAATPLVLVAEHPDFEPARRSVDPDAASAVEIRLTPALAIEGRVVDAAGGDGIPGASIRFFRAATGRACSTTSDADGRYRLRGVPLAPRPAPDELRVEKIGWDLDREALARALAAAPPDARMLALDLRMIGRGRIEGRVRLPDGSPAGGTTVFPWLTPEGHWIASAAGRTPRRVHGFDTLAESCATTDASGRFRVEDAPCGVPLVVVASLPPNGDARAKGIVLRAGEQREGVDLVLEAGASIDGTVTAESRGAVAGAALTAIRIESADLELEVTETRSGYDGTFRLDGLGAGEWAVAATASGFPPPERVRVTLRAGETSTVAILLPSADAEISGRVTDVAGRPIASAELTFLPENRAAGSAFVPVTATTGEDGSYRAGGLESGRTFSLRVEGPRGGQRYASASRRGVRIGDEADFVLHRAATIRGAIRGLDPLPSWVLVEARIPDPADATRALFSRSAAVQNGRYEIAELQEGTYEVSASLADGRRARRANVRIAEGEVADDVDVVFGRPGLAGKVVGPTGAPIAGADVELAKVDAEGSPMDSTIRHTTTDRDGRFAFSDVDEGGYALVASDTTHAPALMMRRVGAESAAFEPILKLTDGGFIAGSVLDADEGTPIVGAHVAAFLVTGRFPLLAVTDSDGRFRIRVPAGTFAVAAMRGIGEPVAGETCEVREGAETSVVLRVRRGT